MILYKIWYEINIISVFRFKGIFKWPPVISFKVNSQGPVLLTVLCVVIYWLCWLTHMSLGWSRRNHYCDSKELYSGQYNLSKKPNGGLESFLKTQKIDMQI